MKAVRISIDKFVSTVAARWAQQYYRNGGKWDRCHVGDSELVYNRLLAKGLDITAEEANNIIGNFNWACLYCDGCEEAVYSDVVSVGSGGDSESDSCRLCRKCVLKALAAFEGGVDD